jgi:8-oxo-dGTP diphosphatase
MREFGDRTIGVVYAERPGAYAVITGSSGEVALIRTARGYFLPGGGIDGDEKADAALRREIHEELGHDAVILGVIGTAAQYVHAPDECCHFRKVGHFYHAVLADKVSESPEPDHHLEWHQPAAAIALLTQEFQAWAVRTLFSGMSPVIKVSG